MSKRTEPAKHGTALAHVETQVALVRSLKKDNNEVTVSGIMQNCTVAMYTDDTGLYYRSASLAQLNETINKVLESLDNWLKGNKLSLNVVKTDSMNILSRQKHQKVLGELDLKIRDTNIQNVKETKYFGLQIDRHLTWKKHVDSISRKVSRTLGVLKHAKKYLPQHLEEIVYKHNRAAF